MKNFFAVLICVAGAVLLAGCGQQAGNDGAKQATPAPAAAAALVVPPANDERAWKLYLSSVVKQHMEGIRSSPYMYYLPAEGSDEFQEQFDRQRDNVAGAVFRGVLPGNMLAFGSPSSDRMADLIVEAFEGVSAGSMKGVRVLFIGSQGDLERVKEAIEPTGASVVFHEIK